MLYGPAFLREDFAQAFSAPLTTPHAVLKPAHADDAGLIAEFFNADDYALRRSWGWDVDEDYNAAYVQTNLLSHLTESDENTNQFKLHIYDASCTQQLGVLQFGGWGKASNPYFHFYFLPSTNDAALATEVAAAVMKHVEPLGLIMAPQPRLADIVRAEFNKVAGSALETPRLSIRPYVAADDDKIKSYAGLEILRLSGYHEKETVGLERAALYAGIFSRVDGGLIGEVDFWQDGDHQPRMSYNIIPTAQGQGMASEMHQACMKWTDGFLSVPITRAEIEPDNQASAAVLRKSGFHEIGEVLGNAPGYETLRLIRFERTKPVVAP